MVVNLLPEPRRRIHHSQSNGTRIHPRRGRKLLTFASKSFASREYFSGVYPITECQESILENRGLVTDKFTRMLASLGKQREQMIEIGRWVVDPAFRNGRSLAPGIGLELAAGAGALALALADQIESGNGVAIFSAGTRDGQYLTLSRLGLKMVAGLSPVRSSEYNDFIQVLHCDSATKLQPRLRRIIESLSIAMRIEETVQVVHSRTLYSSSASD